MDRIRGHGFQEVSWSAVAATFQPLVKDDGGAGFALRATWGLFLAGRPQHLQMEFCILNGLWGNAVLGLLSKQS